MPDRLTHESALALLDRLQPRSFTFGMGPTITTYPLSGADLESLRAYVAASAADTERLARLIDVLQLTVVRDEPTDWTCWLELPCTPSRSRTTDVREFIDLFKHFDAARAASIPAPEASP